MPIPPAKRQYVIDTMMGKKKGPQVTNVAKRNTTKGAPSMPNVRKSAPRRGKYTVGDATLRRKGFTI